ncbi:MAG: TetR/AcrR family transcriptional regulator [Maricaulaceae bacterium]
MTATLSTRDQILDCAQGLIQTRGYNGFSFRDIASDIGIKSSSIHYYYPGKTDLAVAVASKYRSDFTEMTQDLLDSDTTSVAKLQAYADVFEVTLKHENRLCLCGMLASEVNSVEPELRAEIKAFFDDQHRVLMDILSDGQSKGEVRADLQTSETAKSYLAALEGAMMLARVNSTPSDIQQTAQQMIALIKT